MIWNFVIVADLKQLSFPILMMIFQKRLTKACVVCKVFLKCETFIANSLVLFSFSYKKYEIKFDEKSKEKVKISLIFVIET